MLKLTTESNIKQNLILIDYEVSYVNLNERTFIRNDETMYEYDTYKFNNDELIETDINSRKVEMLIRTKYSINQEFAILRQRDTKPNEYNEYNLYCEECKVRARNE